MNSNQNRTAVIGAGVIGLSTAIRLREKGRAVTVFAENRTPHVTSDRAGAIFSPFRIDGHPDAIRWTRDSLSAFAKLAADRSAESGVSMGTMREFFFTPLTGNPWWSSIVPNFERIDQVPAPYSYCVRAVMPKMDMRRYVPWLESRFTRELNGTIQTRNVTSFDELFAEGYDIVINCTGIGAAQLASDPAVTPYCGQILRVRNTMKLTECILEESREEIGSYVFAFDDYLVLGGTFERGQTSTTPDPAAIEAIIERCKSLLRAAGTTYAGNSGSITDVEHLADDRITALAGLRPCRDIGPLHEAVRLEHEKRPDNKTLIHNYGHGRAGVTLSWGCADQVVSLINSTK